MLFTDQSTDGETTGGGFPGWVGNVAGDLRTNNPNYKDGLFSTDCRASCRSIRVAWTPYMTAISKIIARNQITEGGPSAYCQIQEKEKERIADMCAVILVQAENEFSASASHDVYMQDIIDLYRSNGIVVRESHKQCLIFALD